MSGVFAEVAAMMVGLMALLAMIVVLIVGTLPKPDASINLLVVVAMLMIGALITLAVLYS